MRFWGGAKCVGYSALSSNTHGTKTSSLLRNVELDRLAPFPVESKQTHIFKVHIQDAMN